VPCSLTLNDEPNAFTLAHFCIRPSSLLSGRLVDSVIASGPFYVAPSRDYDPFLAKTHKPPPAPRLDLLELLVRTGGADVKARDTYDETPLIWLGRAGGDDLERALDLLLELGADVRVRSQTNVDTYSRGDDGTRRREATRAPDVMPLQALLENEFGASVEVRIACARKLIAAGAPTSGIYDAYGNNLLTSAAMQYKKNGALRLIKFLLEEVGLDVNERSPITGGTALCSAIWPEEDVIHALLDAGADIKATDNNGRTALHACCDEDNIKVGALQFLLERGAPAGGRDHNGLTVLMHVCCNYDALQRQREDKTQYWAVMDELWRRSSDETRRAVSPDEHASNDKGSSAVDFLVESWTNARFMWSVGDDHDPYLDDKLKEMVVTMLLAGVPMLPEHAEDVLPMVVSHGVPRIGRAKSELRELRSEKRRWMAHDDVVQLALDVVEVREVDEVVRRRERRVAELEEELRRRGIGSEEEDDDDEGTAAASQERP
jgi:ankyrin repeat protein